MKKFKSLPIVLLPTDRKTNLCLEYNKLITSQTQIINCTQSWQHLYILTDDVIFKGDWVLYENPNTQRKLVVKVSSVDGNTFDYERQTLDIREIPLKWAQKIIASTDSSLGTSIDDSTFPSTVFRDYYVQPIPESLIKNYITAFNAGKPITAIHVEYKEVVPGRYAYVIIPENTPSASTEKDSWNREDLEFFKGTSGNHIEWIYQRLVHKHNENPQYDYMIKLKELSNWVAENL